MPVWKYLPSYSIPITAFLGILLATDSAVLTGVLQAILGASIGAQAAQGVQSVLPTSPFWAFLTPIYIFLLIPFVEWMVGADPSNHDAEAEERAKASKAYSLLLWSYVPIQYALTGFLLWIAAAGHLSGLALAGAILSVGVSNGGTGITVAHELIHRSSRFEQWLGRALLLSTFYMHFAIEHVYGHHKHVATDEDPATAKKGENFYRFWLRTVPEQYLSAWMIERERLRKKKKGFWTLSNEMILFHLLQVSLVAGIGFTLGWTVAGVFLLSCLIAFSLLEAVNYLEHYGLERHEQENGRFEKVDHHHSWNSDHVVSRMFLFELSRHSDHHAVASRKYQVLRSFEESPQLPTGYPGMVLLALLPPLWFKVMDPLVDRAARH